MISGKDVEDFVFSIEKVIARLPAKRQYSHNPDAFSCILKRKLLDLDKKLWDCFVATKNI